MLQGKKDLKRIDKMLEDVVENDAIEVIIRKLCELSHDVTHQNLVEALARDFSCRFGYFNSPNFRVQLSL